MTNRLSQVVTGVAVKRMSAVEALPSQSNQHEFNGDQGLRELFGERRRTSAARFVYLGDDDSDVTHADGFVTWYDARAGHPTRSEYRLYFPRTAVSDLLRQGDLALLLLRPSGDVLIAFAGNGSTAESQLLWLFQLTVPAKGTEARDVERNDSEIGFAAREILSELGIELDVAPEAEESALRVLLDQFPDGFPSTAEFSEFARGAEPDVEPVDDPDGALIAWLEREEALFRQFERHLVLSRLKTGFVNDVDGFISFSLSVQNRRKARVGYALENHVEAILRANGIAFTRGAVTERRSRPDFLFPSIEAYRNPATPPSALNMLATKSTCKDRWRQVLAEADRVEVKHLLTLEPGISSFQTDEMLARGVALVVPRALHETFSAVQRDQILTVRKFISSLPSS